MKRIRIKIQEPITQNEIIRILPWKQTNYILPVAAFVAGALLAKSQSGAGIGANKYVYHKVIQQNWGYGWDDVDFYECDSTGYIKDQETRELFKTNLRAYRTEPGQPYPRVITRKELKKA